MNIKSLFLSNYRNYVKENIDFSSGTNIIYGMNAQGKTNILEAIYICASGRSHRTSKDHELVRFGEQFFQIGMTVERENNDIGIDISYSADDKKKIKINGSPINRLGELMGNLNAIIFSPEDLMMIKEGPSERRKFMDISISQLKPSYFYDLQQYAKILQHRNGLLKDIQNNSSLIEMLDIWNTNLIDVGSRIIYQRVQFINKMSPIVLDIHQKLTGGKERLEIKYQPCFNLESGTMEQIKASFEKAVSKAEKVELMKGSTMQGPQRDDMHILINDTDVKYFGSQGQQRTAVLTLKLAELVYMKKELGEYPVLLLDDVMSELDSERQKFLLRNLGNIQVFITCTERQSFEGQTRENARFYNVSNGKITIN